MSFYINREGFFRNAFTLYVNRSLHKYQCINIVFNQASENQPGIGRRSRETKVRGAVRAGEGRCRQIGSYGTPL
ncbi:hypothetical protein C0033_10900 [Clostridium sp. chh4-2]|uniref:hypothetical protein n=1 Tax=Clostridium sp. chh4-2 TaxID=2067550 RepID=UPI000CCE94F1|nr:hypothetical protein [Clostridium sp. chh4-2]PNV62151.1 hypothetical protein C0033_10900 [Clostridium sp. chh4-2]